MHNTGENLRLIEKKQQTQSRISILILPPFWVRLAISSKCLELLQRPLVRSEEDELEAMLRSLSLA
jgi:hypothetical protein